VPRVDAIAAKDTKGTLWLEITNLDPNEPVEIEAALTGVMAKSASGETLTAPKVDSINTFDAANRVTPKPISASVQGGKLTLKLEPKSVTVVSVDQ
jgi:alpha-N-arabinofuranosidase